MFDGGEFALAGEGAGSDAAGGAGGVERGTVQGVDTTAPRHGRALEHFDHGIFLC